jgi:hypothetical protein
LNSFPTINKYLQGSNMPVTSNSSVHPADTMPSIEMSRMTNGQHKNDVPNGAQNYKSEKPQARQKYFWMLVLLSALLFITCILTGVIVHHITKSSFPQCTSDEQTKISTDTSEMAPTDHRYNQFILTPFLF